MGGTQTIDKVQQRTLFYYPNYGFLPGREKEGYYARRVLAGVAGDGKILVGEARCFTGNSYKDGDQFNKKRGRQIAEARANAGKTVLEITIPNGEKALGKLFVAEVEKYYPKHVGTPKKRKSEPISKEV